VENTLTAHSACSEAAVIGRVFWSTAPFVYPSPTCLRLIYRHAAEAHMHILPMIQRLPFGAPVLAPACTGVLACQLDCLHLPVCLDLLWSEVSRPQQGNDNDEGAPMGH